MDDRDWRPGWPESEPGWSAWVLVLGICFLGSVGGTADSICERWVAARQAQPTHSHAMAPAFEDHELPRSGRWPAVRAKHLTAHPACEVCGRTSGVQVHHCWPFRERPELELAEGNLITVCGPDGCNAHFWLAHSGRWKGWNPHIREDAVWMKHRWDESKRLAKEP